MEPRNVGLWVLSTCVLLITCVQGQRDRGLQPPQLQASANLKQVIYFREKADEIDLECLAEGIPTPTYEWRRTVDGGTPEEKKEVIRQSNMFALREGRLTISNPVVNKVPKGRGLYQCFASNDHGTAMSREIDVKYAFLNNFPTAAAQNTAVTVGQHVTLRCTDAPSSDPKSAYNWLKDTGVIKRTSRIAVGLDGSLHIINVEQGDEQSAKKYYNCSLNNAQVGSTVYGAPVLLTVNTGTPQNRPPTISYHKPEVVGMLGEKAELQCIPDGNPIPDIIWQNPPNGRSRVDDFNRLLTISELVESDEGVYTCEATSSGGQSKTTINLKIRSQPIWEEKPEAQIVPEGETATFSCKARGTQSDGETVKIQWYKDGVELRSGVSDPNIYVQGSELSVQHLKKPKHIMNIQCKVKNSYGSDIADASLNVIIPTKIVFFPQDVLLDEDNHVAEFRVNAEVDPLKTSNMKYIWKTPAGDVITSTNRNDAIYKGSDGTLVVNTTKMSGQEYKDALGNYTCTVSVGVPRADKVMYVVLTTTDPKPIIEEVVAADLWWIAIIVAVLVIILIIILIVCLMYRNRGGTWPVDEKERKAGHDPEKELADSGFHDLSRALVLDGPDEKKPPDAQSLSDDDKPLGEDTASLDEYGEPDAGMFNEDGSFIGRYASKPKEPTQNSHHTPPQVPQKPSHITQSMV